MTNLFVINGHIVPQGYLGAVTLFFCVTLSPPIKKNNPKTVKILAKTEFSVRNDNNNHIGWCDVAS